MSARRFLALLGALLIMLAPSAIAATAQAAPAGHGATTVSRASAHHKAHKHKKHHKKKPVHHTAPAKHACTHTSSGSCIRGGEFCPQASYGMTGWDASNRHYVCKGDHTHPHWELP